MFPERLVNYGDIARGVVDLVVDSARSAVRGLWSLRHQMLYEGRSEHFQHDDVPNDPLASHPQLFADPLGHIATMTNRWDSEGRYFEE